MMHFAFDQCFCPEPAQTAQQILNAVDGKVDAGDGTAINVKDGQIDSKELAAWFTARKFTESQLSVIHKAICLHKSKVVLSSEQALLDKIAAMEAEHEEKQAAMEEAEKAIAEANRKQREKEEADARRAIEIAERRKQDEINLAAVNEQEALDAAALKRAEATATRKVPGPPKGFAKSKQAQDRMESFAAMHGAELVTPAAAEAE